jgi:hypothetical protein
MGSKGARARVGQCPGTCTPEGDSADQKKKKNINRVWQPAFIASCAYTQVSDVPSWVGLGGSDGSVWMWSGWVGLNVPYPGGSGGSVRMWPGWVRFECVVSGWVRVGQFGCGRVGFGSNVPYPGGFG